MDTKKASNCLTQKIQAAGRLCRHASPTARWRIVLIGFAAAFLVYLIDAENPWRVARRAGEQWQIKHLVPYWLWWAAAANAVILAGLAVISPWWAGKQPAGGQQEWPAVARNRWFWPLVAAACIVCGVSAAHRMNISLWDDEEYTVRRFVLGTYERHPETGEPFLKTVDWQRTFFDYRKPNNHVPHSVLARASLTVWRVFADDPPRPFSDWVVRLPAFVFGLAAIAMTAWLLKSIGLAWAGVAAAWVLALHPWHLRYASEARGYGMAMFFVMLMAAAWIYAMRSGTWRGWAAFGAAQFLLIYTYPATLFVLVLFNAATPLVLRLSKACAGPWNVQMGRWFVSNTISAMAAIQLMLPLLPQMLDYMATDDVAGTNINKTWFLNVGSSFIGGVVWRAGHAKFPQMSLSAADNPVLFWVVVWVAVAFLVLGFVTLFRKSLLHGFVGLVLAGAPLATVLHAQNGDIFLYIWYIVFALPGFVFLVAAGGAAAFRFIPWGGVRVALGAGLIVLFAAVTHYPRAWLIKHSMAPMKESVEHIEHMLAAGRMDGGRALRASFATPPVLYDPRYIFPRNAGEFIELIQRAESEGRMLVVNSGHITYARTISPQMLEMATSPELFDLWFWMDGYDQALDRMVVRYIPGSAGMYDFSRFDRSKR